MKKVVGFTAAFILFCASFVFLTFWYIDSLAQHDQAIPLIETKHAGLKTGDVVLLRHQKYKLGPIAQSPIISHIGLIWNHAEHGLCLVDLNPDPQGPYCSKEGQTIPFPVYFKGPNTLIYSIYDAVRYYPGDIYVRRLKKSLSDAQELLVSKAITEWAIHLRYEPYIKDRDFFVYLSFIVSTLAPEVALLLAYLTPLTQSRTSSFCTEMVSEVLFRANVLQEKQMHNCFIWGPLAWLKGLGQAAGGQDSLWLPEVQLL